MYMPGVWTQNGTYSFGVSNPTGSQAYILGTPGNTDVSWETADKQNYGIDLKMLNNRLSLSVDYFKENVPESLYHQIPPLLSSPPDYQT